MKNSTIINGIGIFVAFLLCVELASAWIHFQRSAERGSALFWAISRAYQLWERSAIDRSIQLSLGGVSERDIEKGVFSALGASVLFECKMRYENLFQKFVGDVKTNNGIVIVLYIPSDRFSLETGREYFRSISDKYGVIFVDVTEAMSKFPRDVVFLLPTDTHPSRFGHYLIAKILGAELERWRNHRATIRMPMPLGKIGKVEILGDYPRNMDQIMLTNPLRPFRMHTNSQGLRMNSDVQIDHDGQLILILGDSFTSGTSVADEDTYTSMISRQRPGDVVVNAGVGGYGLQEELSLFYERMRAIRNDIVVLQVLDHDLTKFLWYQVSIRATGEGPRPPTAAEQALLRTIARTSFRPDEQE